MSDPRVFFAAERTLLAWVRTGLTVIALGFVVARFGLFLSLIAAAHVAAGRAVSNPVSATIGIALVILGSAAIAGALYRHAVYVRCLPPADVPSMRLPGFTSFLAAALAVAGFLLAGYLAVT